MVNVTSATVMPKDSKRCCGELREALHMQTRRGPRLSRVVELQTLPSTERGEEPVSARRSKWSEKRTPVPPAPPYGAPQQVTLPRSNRLPASYRCIIPTSRITRSAGFCKAARKILSLKLRGGYLWSDLALNTYANYNPRCFPRK